MSYTTGAHSEFVQRRAVGDISPSEGISKRIQDVVVQRVRLLTVLNGIELFHVIKNAVLLIAPGRGTPGARAKVAAHHNKEGRCV